MSLRPGLYDRLARSPRVLHPGRCAVCRGATLFFVRGAWLRDQYLCLRCGSIPRERALMTVLERRFPEWRDLAVHESSPGRPSSRAIARQCPRYVASFCFPGVPSGARHRGSRCEDLERQSFPDGALDLVVTQDVMEHVLDPPAAFREIARTLRPGGAHVFTTPIWPGLAKSEVRARRRRGAVELLAPPEFHGDPISKGGCLVTIHYGADIAALIEEASGLKTTVHRLRDRRQGLDGEFLEVLVSEKR